ncbi:serine/threonine-protein kinase [Mycobacterium asiaticum]|uniref:non-specific serine/threonine protein kinase n=1 Tax=Mycobacterium asiaticum TaxID=1790 RepID=A0A1A3NJM5_MYCAS|nr:serine/threonine-protein kinase [Mycobacterium asiaticum]OBK22016.1 serine/threonine protein kinase [Mycobacterium asiaticum]
MALDEGSTFAGYTIIRRLGSGGMGEVYLARHPRLPRQDALKVLRTDVSADREYRERFHREADTAAALWHQHIVAVHDRGETDGQLWIDMDYVDGTDAGQLLEERYTGGMPGPEVVDIITAVAEALDYAHEHKLLHRDVKPANILIARPDSPDRRIMLADFGIAGLVGESTGLTATNMTVGTVAYAAPEQLMGNDLDGRADQYALAASAFQLLTGAPPFQHSNPAVVISQHLSASPPAIGDRRPALANLDPVFAKALAKDPKDRYLRCVDFARALGHHLGDVGDAEATSASMPVTAPPKGSLRPAALIPAVLAILLVIAVALAIREYERADEEEHAAPGARTSSATISAPASVPAQQTPAPTGSATTGPAVPVPVVAIGAVCAPLGSTGITKTGATAYCSKLQDSDATIWSLTENTVASATVSSAPEPSESPVPTEQEGPIRICMQQTGQTRRQCREEILRSNGLP